MRFMCAPFPVLAASGRFLQAVGSFPSGPPTDANLSTEPSKTRSGWPPTTRQQTLSARRNPGFGQTSGFLTLVIPTGKRVAVLKASGGGSVWGDQGYLHL